MASKRHPSQRFRAPTAIEHGRPLKELMDRRLVTLIGESLETVSPTFCRRRFARTANRDLEAFELKDRARHIAQAMFAALPSDSKELTQVLIDSLGPVLEATSDNGLAPFFYLPHSQLVGEFLVSDFQSGMRANYELTKRFTAEFSIRPYLTAYRDRSLKRLHTWARDANPHVRRLVSEGTRPRLPWAMRLTEFQADPSLAAPLLELLKDDADLYVRRSVANHIGDIAKDHLEFAVGLCESWLAETQDRADETARNRRWIVRHAVRHPAKKGNAQALALRERAAERR